MISVPGFELGTAIRACAGADVSGDLVVVVRGETALLVGLADGLGHGPPAAVAASAFRAAVEEKAEESLSAIMRHADRRLQGTRGAVAALLRADGRRIELVVVGNVGFRAHAVRKMSVLPLPGVVGRLGARAPRPFGFDLSPGDVVVLHSDGITAPELDAVIGLDAERAAQVLIERHGRADDDAGCAVLRATAVGVRP